ncbi:MAG: hypothetical protein IJD81_07695 [Oscillospiraceae bacterium]|nr:hypothetical protein [Oscillospiraceae bacterium]
MTLNYFKDHMFDLLNESDLLDVYDIQMTETGYRVTVHDGSEFEIAITDATPRDNIVQLFPCK